MASNMRNALKKSLLISIYLLSAAHGLWSQTARQSLNIVITNGHIIDGTGSPWYSGDIGVRDGRIAAIGNLSDAQRTRTIDVHGMVVAPGFMDMLGQSELTILVDPRVRFENPNQLSQGMEYVLVNGVPVIDEGKQTGALPGKVLRGAGYVP